MPRLKGFALAGQPGAAVPTRCILRRLLRALVERDWDTFRCHLISRCEDSAQEDRERYQTVYAACGNHGQRCGANRRPALYAAGIVTIYAERGIEIADLTLHVGLGTFQPVHAGRTWKSTSCIARAYSISEECGGTDQSRAGAEKRRVVAVGTTTVRTLEFVAWQNALNSNGTATVSAGSGEADIFIYPGFQFRAVNALLTNFHLPKSTLLMLVAGFAGREKTC